MSHSAMRRAAPHQREPKSALSRWHVGEFGPARRAPCSGKGDVVGPTDSAGRAKVRAGVEESGGIGFVLVLKEPACRAGE